MSSYKEAIYTLKNIRAGGKQTDDVVLSDDNYVDILNYYRAKLIRQEIDRGQRLDPSTIQSLSNISVERVVFDRGQPLSGKTVYRTVSKIPKAVETSKNNLVTFVGHNLLGKNFQRSTPYKVQLDIHRALTSSEPKWFEYDERIYVITEDSLQKIMIQLVAENPLRVHELNNTLDIFNPLDTEFPLSDSLRDSIYKLVADAEYKILGIVDEINDGRENSSE